MAYLGLYIFSIALYVLGNRKENSLVRLLANVLVATITGIRFKTGNDTETYMNFYLGFDTKKNEVGFQFLQDYLANSQIPFYYFFLLIALIMWVFMWLALENMEKEYRELTFFFLLTNGYFISTLSGIRSVTGISILFYGLFLLRKEKKRGYLYFLFSILFHKSQIVVSLFYSTVLIKWKRGITYFITIICLIAGHFTLLLKILLILPPVLLGGYYESYIAAGRLDDLYTKTPMGVIFLIRLILFILIITVREKNEKMKNEKLYNLYIYLYLLEVVSINIPILIRLVYLRYSLESFIYAHFLMNLELNKKIKRTIIFLILSFFTLVYFKSTILSYDTAHTKYRSILEFNGIRTIEDKRW